MSALPSRLPRFRELFDSPVVACLLLLAALAAVSCDIVNRSVNRRLLPKAQEPDPSSWTTGTATRVLLTLRTQDAERHACASGQHFDTYRCEYDGNKRRVTRGPQEPLDDNQRWILQPFKTAVGNHSLLVGGIWYTPELAFRRHQEPARERRGNQLQPFYADCEVTFVGQLETLDVRYDFGKAWTAVKNTPVARAERCTILEP